MATDFMSRFGVSHHGPDVPARHWDIVFTCFEPLTNVTGGIGSYHRLLINELARAGKSQLILTRKVNADWMPPEGACMFVVDDLSLERPYNFVGLEHEHFSLRCHFAFDHLYRQGHRFGLVEFSDYGGDGFYPLRARAAGMYGFDRAAVRLHSPNVMLIEDNGRKHSQISQYQRDLIDREMSAYDDCDVILYGGDAMRDRVLGLARKFGHDVSAKMVKCPHPYPKSLFRPQSETGSADRARMVTIQAVLKENRLARREALESARFVGLFGRIEDRKGQYQFISGLLQDKGFAEYLRASDIHFLVAGHNVLDHVGNFRLRDLYDLIYKAGLSDRFHFTGRVSQDILAEFSHAASGYVFPSIFENYPNALLEVLPTTKPIAVSSRGCMSEITQGFRDVTVFDPLAIDIDAVMDFLQRLPPGDFPVDQKELAHRVAILEARQEQMLAWYCAPVPGAQADPEPRQSVGFVVPIHQVWTYLDDTLSSILPAMRQGDRIVVVDDASDPENLAEIRQICGKHGVELVAMPVNGGPSAARLCGVQHLDTDLIQFCDADDLLDPDGIFHARQAFANDPGLDMVTGIMSCFQDAHHNWVPRNGHIWTAIEAHFAHSGSMFRKSAILHALDHDRLPLNEDWLTSLLVLANGGKARMIPAITYHYRRFDGTRSTLNVALTGSVHAQIVSKALESWSFACPPQNARLRELMVARSFGNSENVQLVTASHFPLRYRMLDSVFFRMLKIPLVESMFLKLRARLARRFD